MTQPIDLPAIRQRTDAATPGPWTAARVGSYSADVRCEQKDPLYVNGTRFVSVLGASMTPRACLANAAFAAAARADVPALCDEVERLREWVMAAYLEGFSTGNGFMALPPGDDLMDTAVRCWKESQAKKEV